MGWVGGTMESVACRWEIGWALGVGIYTLYGGRWGMQGHARRKQPATFWLDYVWIWDGLRFWAGHCLVMGWNCEHCLDIGMEMGWNRAGFVVCLEPVWILARFSDHVSFSVLQAVTINHLYPSQCHIVPNSIGQESLNEGSDNLKLGGNCNCNLWWSNDYFLYNPI